MVVNPNRVMMIEQVLQEQGISRLERRPTPLSVMLKEYFKLRFTLVLFAVEAVNISLCNLCHKDPKTVWMYILGKGIRR